MTSRWTVIWKRSLVERKVAEFVAEAIEKGYAVAEITNAMDQIDRVLSLNPASAGESRSGSDRVLIQKPLVITFEIHEDEHVVLVFGARYVPDKC